MFHQCSCGGWNGAHNAGCFLLRFPSVRRFSAQFPPDRPRYDPKTAEIIKAELEMANFLQEQQALAQRCLGPR